MIKNRHNNVRYTAGGLVTSHYFSMHEFRDFMEWFVDRMVFKGVISEQEVLNGFLGKNWNIRDYEVTEDGEEASLESAGL